MVRTISQVHRGSRRRSIHMDAETGVYRRRAKRQSKPLFPPPLSDAEILNIVDDLTESLLDW